MGMGLLKQVAVSARGIILMLYIPQDNFTQKEEKLGTEREGKTQR